MFPLRPGSKRPRPEFTSWETVATLDPDRIRGGGAGTPTTTSPSPPAPPGWWSSTSTSPAADEPRPPEQPDARGGPDVYRALPQRHGHVPDLDRETASGGRHLYFRAPAAGGPWRNTAGRIGWHIDTRAAGGYVVAAGSIVDGRPYTLVHDPEPAELPAWLAALAPPRHRRPRPPATARHPRGGATPPRRWPARSSASSTPRSASATPR